MHTISCTAFVAKTFQSYHLINTVSIKNIHNSFNPKRNDNGNIPSGAAETAAGAIFGGLVGGPFGALFGAQIGSKFGAKRASDDSQQKEMERLGLTPEMVQMAQEVGVALDRGLEGLKATKESLESQQRFARRLDDEATQTYDQAKIALTNSDEEKAKSLLSKRENTLKRLKSILQDCADAKRRVDQMESNVEALEQRALEVDSLLKRNIGAKAMQDLSDNDINSSYSSMRLEDDDPLIRKFKDLERM